MAREENNTTFKTLVKKEPLESLLEKRWRLDTGQSPFRIVDWNKGSRQCLVEYIRSKTVTCYPTHRILLKDDEEEEQTMTKDLYKLTLGTKEVYANRVGTDRNGKAVIQVVGTDEVMAVDSKALEIVLPYTISVRFAGAATDYSFFATPGTVKEGDIVLREDEDNDFSFCRVTKIDTKSRRATKRLKGVLLSGFRLPEGDEENEAS